MARAHDGEETGHGGRNIHRPKRPREDLSWSPEASQELLRLRFQTLRTLFDEAETVADVHEAWGVVAARLNDMEEVEMEVDAVKCSDQLTRLRQQWQGDRTAQLHAMMSECFRKKPIQSGRRVSSETEETVVQETSYEESPKRKKKATHQNEVTSPSADARRAETPLSPEPALVPNVPPAPTVCQHEVPELLEQPDSVSPQPAEQETPSVRKDEVQAVDVEEFPQQDRIMRALEKRSEQLGRLAQSHKQLADVSHKLLEALLDRQGKM